MGAYRMKYTGENLDQTIEYVLRNIKSSTYHTLECSVENPVDLNTLTTEEGLFTCQYFVHSADDNDNSAVVLTVVFYDESHVVQQYDLNGITVRRTYDTETNTWTNWLPVQSFVQASQDEEVVVGTNTLVMREVTGDVDELFEE